MHTHRRRIWKHIAFIGRYGHQQADFLLHMPVDDLTMFAKEIAELIQEETEAVGDR